MHDSSQTKPWILWQLIDSAFPVGAFAHSGGLEAAMQLGIVEDGEDVKQFLETLLYQCARSTAPFVLATRQSPDAFLQYDKFLNAMLTSTLPHKASRTQGQALLSTACNIWDCPSLQNAKREIANGFNSHLAIVFGMVAHFLDIAVEDAVSMFLFLHSRGILSTAVRLNVIGPIESQRIQYEIAASSNKLIELASGLSIDQARQTAPILDLIQSQHDRLYSRLFVT